MPINIHLKTHLVPSDYRCLAYYTAPRGFDMGAMEINREHRELVNQHINATGRGFAKKATKGRCYACGAHHNEGATFIHLPTNELVQFGATCACRIECWDDASFRRFQKRAGKARERMRGLAKAKVLLDEDYGLAGVAEWAQDIKANGWGDQPQDRLWDKAVTLIDIYWKLVKYGSLSEKQVTFAQRLWDTVQNADALRAEWAAKREAEQAAAVDAPAGRVDLEGEVLSVKLKESFYGDVYKTLIKCDGYKVWMTLPDSLCDHETLDTIKGRTLKARVTLKPKERGFAIGSRPTNATLI